MSCVTKWSVVVWYTGKLRYHQTTTEPPLLAEICLRRRQSTGKKVKQKIEIDRETETDRDRQR